ncbi:hypothetical protein [Acidithiobacillus sp.]
MTPPPPPPHSSTPHASSNASSQGEVSGNSVNTFSGHSYPTDSSDGNVSTEVTNIGSDATINNQAFENASGVVSANQNSGANSMASNQTNVQVNTVSGGLKYSASTDGWGAVGWNLIEVGTIGATINYDGNSYLGDNAFANASGIISLNQNSAANSLLQNQTNVQVNQLSQKSEPGDGWSSSAPLLVGYVGSNTVDIYAQPGQVDSYDDYAKGLTNYNANSTINGNAFDGASGIISANQNSGANSLLQNQTTVQVTTLGTSTGHISNVLGGEVEGNTLQVTATGQPCNYSSLAQTNYAANATIGGNAFAHASGVISLSQNTGANSMMQNQTSIQVNQ